DRLAEEFVERHRRGERPSPTEYAERHPEWAEEIHELFPALVMMERLKPETGGSTGDVAPAPDRERDRDRAAPPGAPAGLPARRGDYRILRVVGEGGMGVVYEAVQESLGRHVALKVLPLHGRVNPTLLHRFRLEARAAARLHHTNIVPVYGVGESG